MKDEGGRMNKKNTKTGGVGCVKHRGTHHARLLAPALQTIGRKAARGGYTRRSAPGVGSTIVRNWPSAVVPMCDRVIGQFRRIVAPPPASRTYLPQRGCDR